MLLNIFRKKYDHPLADIKAVHALIEKLPKKDAYQSLMELSEWVESVADNTDFKLDHQYAVLRLLDEAVQPFAQRLARDYFTIQESNKYYENRLWLVLGNLYRHTTRAYCAVFNRYCNGDKQAHAITAQVPQLAAHAVYSMTWQLKYVCAHYGSIDMAVWSELARIYRHAEQQNYLDAPLELSFSASGGATLKQQIAHLLGWYGCGVDTLSALYMHLTERIVAQHCADIYLGPQQDATSLFSFDLERPSAPLRVKADSIALLSTRFVSMTPILPKFESLIASLEANTVPDNFDLAGTFEAKHVLDAAKFLQGYLIEPPVRRSARRKIDKVTLSVVNGLDAVLGCAEAGSDEKLTDSWEIDDVSLSGFSTQLSEKRSVDLRIGSLFGVRPEGVAYWGVAVARRLIRDSKKQLNVGVEILANRFTVATLSQRGESASEHAVLWLKTEESASSGEVRLLMKSGTFSTQAGQTLQAEGNSYSLAVVALQEMGPEYDLAIFRIAE
ncbi:MAG: hypothetical protein WCK93_10660 [Nitrosomonadales bacterium]|jgi:hypothetical protein